MSLFPAQITPFREADMYGPNVESMRRFNHYHAKMRVVVENAFGRLKGRWRVLKMISTHPDLAAAIQELCVALHKIWRLVMALMTGRRSLSIKQFSKTVKPVTWTRPPRNLAVPVVWRS